jgi:tetratricopeptide (TPR) repeat protein
MLLVSAVVALSVGAALINRELAMAEANFRKSRAAVDEYFTTVSESKLLDMPGLQPLRKALLESARRYSEDFLKEHGNNRAVRAEAAASLYQLAHITELIDKGDAAVPVYHREIALYRQLVRDHPDNAAYRSDLAYGHSSLGLLLDGRERDEEARAEIRIALDLRTALAHADASNARYQADLARSYRHLGDLHRQVCEFIAAEKHWKTARAIQEAVLAHPPATEQKRRHLTRRGDVENIVREDLADILLDLSGILREVGRWDESLDCGRRGRELLETMLRDRPDDAELNAQLAGGYTNLALTTLNNNHPAESLALAERAIAILEKVTAANPTVTNYSGRLADAYFTAGYTLERLGRLEEAGGDYRHTTELAEGLIAAEPGSVFGKSLVAQGRLYESRLLIRAGRLDEVRSKLRRAHGFQEEIVRDQPRVVFHRFTHAFVCRALGRAQEQSGHLVEATAAFDRVRQLDAAEAVHIFIACYNEACDLALMARVAPPDRRKVLTDQALVTLRQSIAQGYRSFVELSTDTDLDALRDRPDFRDALLDLAFPAHPFVR